MKLKGGPDLQAALQVKKDKKTKNRLNLELTLIKVDSSRAQQIRKELEELGERPLAALISDAIHEDGNEGGGLSRTISGKPKSKNAANL